ncbi:MAG TPA: amidophosphoribosyltransferase [Candidatus Saccharimonadales bacterium]|nr:amidophosphoribosyltransferase [Candidatus Saccharimonadales bacterium]
MAGEAREKCAVGGVLLNEAAVDTAAAHLYEVLFALQHRGDEASGMVSREPGEPLAAHRELGMVKDVYSDESIARLSGRLAVGHNKYTTSTSIKGVKELRHPQPIIDESLGLALAHNGNIPDTTKMDGFLERHNLLHGHRNDSEKMGFTIAQFMRGGQDLPAAVESAYPLLDGAFSCVGTHDDMLVAFRDPHGIRPLALGNFDDNWVVSSETCGLDILNAKYVREVQPGELVVITADGQMESKQLAAGRDKLDIFELVYFARHDSTLYGKTVNEIRRQFGVELALAHGAMHDDGENVVVVPVPDTAVPEAEGYAQSLGLTMTQAIIKNRYIGRTFMQPTDQARKTQLRRKHNIIAEPIKGKDVVLIDDSIVRLNTIPNLVQRMKQIGARSVSVLIGSPPVRFPDYYGIDTPHQSELAAANLTVEEMRRAISEDGCRYLGFLPLESMVRATGMPADMFNLSCFTGEYPIDIGKRQAEITSPVSMEYVE